jgi:hypothetical protein
MLSAPVEIRPVAECVAILSLNSREKLDFMVPTQITRMNKRMKTVLTAVAIGFLGCSMLGKQVQAAPPIVGDIFFSGVAVPSGVSTFGGPVTVSFPSTWQIGGVTSGSTYDANGVTPGSAAVKLDSFTFTGDGALASLSATVPAQWSFSLNGIDYSFDLQTLTNGTVFIDTNDLGAMSFSGTGLLHATNFEDTPANWALQGAQDPEAPGFTFTLSSSTTSSIPEGGVMSLLGLGFVVLAGKKLAGREKSV